MFIVLRIRLTYPSGTYFLVFHTLKWSELNREYSCFDLQLVRAICGKQNNSAEKRAFDFILTKWFTGRRSFLPKYRECTLLEWKCFKCTLPRDQIWDLRGRMNNRCWLLALFCFVSDYQGLNVLICLIIMYLIVKICKKSNWLPRTWVYKLRMRNFSCVC